MTTNPNAPQYDPSRDEGLRDLGRGVDPEVLREEGALPDPEGLAEVRKAGNLSRVADLRRVLREGSTDTPADQRDVTFPDIRDVPRPH